MQCEYKKKVQSYYKVHTFNKQNGLYSLRVVEVVVGKHLQCEQKIVLETTQEQGYTRSVWGYSSLNKAMVTKFIVSGHELFMNATGTF